MELELRVESALDVLFLRRNSEIAIGIANALATAQLASKRASLV